MEVDLDGMSLAQLKALEKDVAKAIVTFEAKRLSAARAAAEAIAREHGFTLAEIVETSPLTKRSKRSLAPKFANPANPAEVWTGLGRRPKWFIDGLAAGKQPEDFRLPS
ncbi:Trans-acting regulatory protein HvrA [bioreactor metagenome]|uniref:Trans-acting regulatory protein HvrA n=1 Tax=bioreactor metagenome TaxID=1076179 RepID=A0A644VL78_9ZZZZ